MIRFLFALSTLLRIASVTSLALPKPKPTLPFLSPTTVKAENEKFAQIRQTAETAVYAAEQLMRKTDPTGEERRKYAHKLIATTAMRLGIALTDNEIDSMIQAAVKELNFFTHEEIADAQTVDCN